MNLENKIKQLKALTQYQNLSDEEVRERAKEILKKKDLQGKLRGDWLSGEKKKAVNLFNNYIKKYNVEKEIDVNLLNQLVFLEILAERCQKRINTLTRDSKLTIPVQAIRTLHENLNQIIQLKEKLGLIEKKEIVDGFTYIQTLKKKFFKWGKENQASRTRICPHCSKMILFTIRTNAWEANKHPFFKDRILTNEHLWKMYKEGRISQEDIAKVLGKDIDYITWLEENIYKS